jgi:NADH-quinone oxidoreductase subunit H
VLHAVAPAATLFFALAAWAIVPFGDGTVSIGGWETTPHMGADNDMAVLFAVAMSGLSGYGVIVGGWASNSKYALLGALRACAQLISYEVSLTLAVLPVVMLAGSLSMVDIANASYLPDWSVLGWNPWFIVWAPIAFAVFCLAALAEANRAPFDMSEAEGELVAGFHTEFGGLRYALFANAEYVHLLTISALGVTFFLGGWHGPWLEGDAWYQGWGMGIIWFLMKLGFFLFLFIWIRATLPRLRYDRLMRFGWKVMLPASTGQFALIAVVVANRGNEDIALGVMAGQWALVLALVAWSVLRRRDRANKLHPLATAMLKESR